MVWIFRHSNGLDRREPHEVEVRINLTKEAIDEIEAVEGWWIAHRKPAKGMLFLRREQPLTNHALRRLFRDAIVFAHRRGGRFHSWMHKPDLSDWD